MNPIDQLLADTGHVEDLSAAGLARGRDLLELASAERRGARPLRRPVTLAATAAALVAAIVTVPVLVRDGRGPSAGAAVLRRAGAAAGAQPGGWPDAVFWHSASVYQRDGRSYQRDIWIAHHGQSVLRDTGLPGNPGLLPADGGFDAGGTALTWDQLYALPTDPGALKSVLETDIKVAGPDPTTELFVAVGDLLRGSPAAPALREALYDVAAGIPGVRVAGQVTDSAGRTGTALSYGDETYVIDPSDGRLLAATEPGWTATYLSQGPAQTAPGLTAK